MQDTNSAPKVPTLIIGMSPAARRDMQLEYEQYAVDEGIKRYRDNLAKRGHLATDTGQTLMKAALGPMESALGVWLEECRLGVGSRSASVFYFVDQMDAAAVSWITAQTIFALFHKPTVKLASCAIQLAMALEDTINTDAIVKANPRLGKKVASKLASYVEGRNRAIFIRKGAELADVKIVLWDDSVRLRVGTLLIQMFAQSTGLVTVDEVFRSGGAKKYTTVLVVKPTAECLGWLAGSHAHCELLSPTFRPMLCKPTDWTTPFKGGYLTAKLRRPLVKTRNKAYLSELKEWDMPNVYNSVNALQATQWAVNVDVYDVIHALWSENITVAKLPSREKLELPNKPWTEGTTPGEEELRTWKTAASKVHADEAAAISARFTVESQLSLCRELMDRGNLFYYPYNTDWRSRFYASGAGLNPQGNDSSKGLLKFFEGTKLGTDGAYWLAVHGANCFGIDKVDFEERTQWVENHHDLIIDCARDSLNNLWWSTTKDNPFMFLAFCKEWAKLQDWVDSGNNQEDFLSYLPVSFDGTCNGLQNLSALVLDEAGGAVTGLSPNVKPRSIYTEVAKASQAIIDGVAELPGDSDESVMARKWAGKINKEIVKVNTMTTPYDVTRMGLIGQVDEAISKLLKDGTITKDMTGRVATTLIYKANYEAIGKVVVAARTVMDWLKEAASVAAKNSLPVSWVTPIGFPVLQSYTTEVGEKHSFTVLGRRFQIMISKDGDKIDQRKQRSGISPNFVHSLDAAHMMRTILYCANSGITNIAMIHDSYGCPAGQAAALRDNLRRAFVDQYSQPVLDNFRQELIEQLPEELADQVPPTPLMGTLDLEGVLESDYFFA